jgi:hypothetical protein
VEINGQLPAAVAGGRKKPRGEKKKEKIKE